MLNVAGILVAGMGLAFCASLLGSAVQAIINLVSGDSDRDPRF